MRLLFNEVKAKIIVIVLLSLFSIPIFAQQQQGDSIKQTIDTTRIIDLSDKLSLWLYGINKVYNFSLLSKNTGRHIDFRPNSATKLGLGFNYKWLGLGIAFNMPWAKNDDDIYGHTQRIDLQINVFARSFGLDVSAQYYKGYYIANPNDFMDWNKKQYPLLKDLITLSTEISGYYFTNHKKFSYRAAFVRNEIQKKSAGSFIIGSYLRSDISNSPGGFIPPDLPVEYRDTFNITDFSSVNIGVAMGYTYTFVFFKNFFINLSLVPGIGYKMSALNDNAGKLYTNNGASIRWVGRIALGYEHKNFFLGATSVSTSNSIGYEHILASSTNSKFRFFVGKRFNCKKK
ncbi:MAG: DUF4421 family protein [Bacteroidales bacterium]|nr:DUF4421 family protein [Bacteroidales bacterium]